MLLEKIKEQYLLFTKSEKKVADAVLKDPAGSISHGISGLSKTSDTSDATIVRFCNKLELGGFYEFRLVLANEINGSNNHISEDNDDNSANACEEKIFWEKMNQQISEVQENLNFESVAEVVEMILNAKSVHFSSWGNTSMIAADFAHRLTRFGVQTFSSFIPEYSMRSLATADPDSLLVAISHSGTSLQVIDSLKLARQLGIGTILIVNEKDSVAAQFADLEICTAVENEIFSDLGAASHIVEYLVIDSMLFLLELKCDPNDKALEAETVLSRHKL